MKKHNFINTIDKYFHTIVGKTPEDILRIKKKKLKKPWKKWNLPNSFLATVFIVLYVTLVFLFKPLSLGLLLFGGYILVTYPNSKFSRSMRNFLNDFPIEVKKLIGSNVTFVICLIIYVCYSNYIN